MTSFNRVLNRQTPIGENDEKPRPMRDWAHSRRLGMPADEAGSVVLRQPPASKLAQFSLLQRFAVWWVAPPWPTLPVPAVLLALCRLVAFD